MDAAVTLACSSFVDEEIIEEIFSKAKVFQLGEVAENLRKWVVEMES